jgi:hypothetical protein
MQLELEVAEAMAGAEQAEGRAQRALRLLCDAHGATAGHLYLVTPAGLQLAASYSTDAPDSELLTLAQAQLDHDLSSATRVTRVAGETSTTRVTHHANLWWTDTSGQPYEPRTLSCVVQGAPRCAGVAILKRSDTRKRANRMMQFSTALSAYLIASGETPGV